jgi:hypothetical protein
MLYLFAHSGKYSVSPVPCSGSARSVSAWILRKRLMKKMIDIGDEKDEVELGASR